MTTVKYDKTDFDKGYNQAIKDVIVKCIAERNAYLKLQSESLCKCHIHLYYSNALTDFSDLLEELYLTEVSHD